MFFKDINFGSQTIEVSMFDNWQLNNTSPVNVALLIARVNRMNELVQHLIANPPTFIVDPRWTWLNASTWAGVLSRASPQQTVSITSM